MHRACCVGIGQHEIAGVAVHRVADELAVDLRAAALGVVEPLQHVHAAAFGDDDAVAIHVERPRGLRRIFVRGQRPLAREAGENAECVNALRDAAGQGHVALAQPQHLGALNHARVAGGTGRADRVVRPGDAHVERDFAGRVVGHGARIVVVRPELRVVVVALDLVDFVFGLDVAVLGHADVDADPLAIDVRPIEPRIGHRFLRTINADAAGPRAAADFLLLLIPQLVELADAGQRFADVANLVLLHAAAAVEQRVAKLGQRIAVRRREPDAGDHNPLMVVERAGHSRMVRSVAAQARDLAAV